MKFQSSNVLEEMMANEAARRRWVVDASPHPVAELTEGRAVVRGDICRLLGSPVVATLDLLEDAPQQEQLAVGEVSVRIQHSRGDRVEVNKLCRPFVLRDATGDILVHLDQNRDAPDLFLQGSYQFYGNRIDGLLIPCAMLGDEVVVAGTVRVAHGSNLASREALPSRNEPSLLAIEACAIYDVDSWALLIRHR